MGIMQNPDFNEILYHFSLNPSGYHIIDTQLNDNSYKILNLRQDDNYLLFLIPDYLKDTLEANKSNLNNLKTFIRLSNVKDLASFFHDFRTTDEGNDFYIDRYNSIWRMFPYHPGQYRYKNTRSAAMAYYTGRLLGKFQNTTSHFDSLAMAETKIPDLSIGYYANVLSHLMAQNKHQDMNNLWRFSGELLKWLEVFIPVGETLYSDVFTKKVVLNHFTMPNLVYNEFENCTGIMLSDTVSSGNRLTDFALAALSVMLTDQNHIHHQHFTAFCLGYLEQIKNDLSGFEYLYLCESIIYISMVLTVGYFTKALDKNSGTENETSFYQYHQITTDLIKNRHLLVQIINKCMEKA